MQTLQLKKPVRAPMLRRLAVCREEEIPLGLGRTFDIGDRQIAVFKARDGQVFAVDGVCPHKGGPLADGMVVGHQVVCPLHAFRFEAHTGNCDQSGICSIDTYPAEIENGHVFIVVPS